MNPTKEQTTQATPPYCIGLDLHCNNVVVAIKKTESKNGVLEGKLVLSKRFPVVGEAAKLQLADALAPYCNEAGTTAVVESTYNWYWLADLFEEKGWSLKICDPSTVSRANIKVADDFTDAAYLAEMLRVDSIKTTPIMPKADRAFRDFARFRQTLVRDRARAKITLVNLFTNHLSERIRVNALVDEAYQAIIDDRPVDGEIVASYFDEPLVRERVSSLLRLILFYDKEIASADSLIEDRSKEDANARQLRTIKGCGKVLSTAIAVELGDLSRFPNRKSFVSYCRLAPTAKLSNGKSKGQGNAKNGNAYLSWALTELANLMIRFNPPAKKFYDRNFNRTHLRVKAIRAVAAKLARAIYTMLKSGESFDVNRSFGT